MLSIDQATEVLVNTLGNNGFNTNQAQRLGTVIFQYFDFFSKIDFDALIDLLQESEIVNLNNKIGEIMKTLDDLKADVAAQKTVTDGLSAAIKGIADQIRNLPSNDPATQQAISDLADEVEANTAAIGQAVIDNTPAANG